MNPSRHLIYGAIFALALSIIFPFIGIKEVLIIVLSTFLIDLDHYIYFMFKIKEFNIFKLYKLLIKKQETFRALPLEKREEYYGGLFIFHGIEILIILLLFGIFVNTTLFYIFVGFAFHLILDISHQILDWRRLDKVSLIHDFFKFKKLKFIKELFD